MTRETKIGLLLGMGVILLIGIIISDQLSQVNQSDPADFTEFAGDTQRNIEATDAAPAPGYHAPKSPADNAPARDIPKDFLIPDDVQQTIQQRQANSSSAEDAESISPLTAYNVAPNNEVRPPESDNIPTLTLGNDEPEAPLFSQPVTSVVQNNVVEREPTPRISPASNSSTVIQHKVMANESLIKIARRYYGNGDYWKAIALANPGKVSNEGHVNSGIVLNIPQRDDAVLGLDIESTSTEVARPVNVRTASARTIEVESGDTLSELASKHLGSAGRWDELLEANRDQLRDERSLQVGMKLKLPGSTAVVADQGRTVSTPGTRSTSKTYTVKPGDNLTEIAEKTLGDGGKWRQIYEANRDVLSSADNVKVGQTLRIPS